MMTEQEALVRAREAAIAGWLDKPGHYNSEAEKARYRAGEVDCNGLIRVALRALLDAHKPLSEVAPVDPDLIEARELVAQYWVERNSPMTAVGIRSGKHDDGSNVMATLAGIKRGRALASVTA